MDNVKLLRDLNLILPQFSSFSDGYSSGLFVTRYLTEHGGLPVEKVMTIKSAHALKVKYQIMH